MGTNCNALRVLQIISGNRYFGGISALLYNVYSHIDREQVQFDFLYPYISTNGIYKEKIETMGGRVYELGITGNKVDRKAKLYPGIRQFLKEHPYEVVHINSGNLLFNLIVSKAARDAGIGTIIVHSHNADAANESKLKQRAIGALKPLLDRQLTARFACSDEAARHMFTEKAVAGNGVTVVRNGIEVQRFLYDEQARGEVRRRLGIENKHVVGHIGRFCPQKNQVFLIKVFARLAETDQDAVLVLIGDGETQEMDRITSQIKQLNLRGKVICLGTQTDVERYYQAFDAFAFPSAWEGLGMVLVEAQVSGLHCVASEAVPRAADVTGNVAYLPIGEGDVDLWVEALRKTMTFDRASHDREAAAAGYDIDSVATGLLRRYLSMTETGAGTE